MKTNISEWSFQGLTMENTWVWQGSSELHKRIFGGCYALTSISSSLFNDAFSASQTI
jgi:hypothetical protein